MLKYSRRCAVLSPPTYVVRLLVSVSRSDATATLSHADCLYATAPDGRGMLYSEDQMSLMEDAVVSMVPAFPLRSRSCCWSVSVPAADAKKAGASELYATYIQPARRSP